MTDDFPESSPRRAYGTWCVGIAGMWLVGIVVGAGVLCLATSGSTRPMSLSRAVFAAANAGSLTGFSWNWGEPGDQAGVAATILCLTILGLLAAWLIPYLAFLKLAWGVDGKQIASNHPPAEAGKAAKRRMYGMTLPLLAIVVAVGAVWVSGSGAAPDGLSGLLLRVLSGVGLVAGAGGSGMALESQSPAFWVMAIPLHLVALLGPLLAARWVAGGALTPQVRLTLLAGSIAFLVGAGLLILTTGATAVEQFVQAVAISVDARSAGFLEETKELPRAAQIAAAPLALLGGLGGVGGGLKVMTGAVLVLGVWRLLRGKRVGPGGAVTGLAVLWIGFVGLIVFATLLALIALLPELPADRLWMLACGATGNVALSIDPVVAAGADGYVLAATMVISRLGGWVVLWLSVRMGPEPVALG